MKTFKKLFCFVLIFCMLFQCQGFAVLAEGMANKNEEIELVELDDSIVSVDAEIDDVILDVESIVDDEEENGEIPFESSEDNLYKNFEDIKEKNQEYDYSEEQEEINESIEEDQEEETDEVLNEKEDGMDNNGTKEFLEDETEKGKDEKDFEGEETNESSFISNEENDDSKEKQENVASDSEVSSDVNSDFNIQIDDIIQTESGDNLVTENVPITLTYNFNDKTNDGTGSTDVYLFGTKKTAWTKEVYVGKPYGKFEEFYRPGYNLVGYSFSRDGEIIKEDDIVKDLSNTTIYAIWEPEKYKLKVSKNVMINDVESDGTSYVEVTFDKDINETMKENGIRPMTVADNKDYDCLTFLGWSFNEDFYFSEDDPSRDSIVGENEKVNFTDHNILMGRISEPTIGALYMISHVHVILNANEGTYGDGEKFLDLGLVPAGSKLNEAVGTLASYTEPTPPKDMRFEKWWFPEYCYTEYGFKDPVPPDNYWLTVGAGDKILDFDVNEYKYRWNEEYKAHFEEDRYLITFWGGGMFPVIVGDQESKWFETGYWNDDPHKYDFKDRLGEDRVFNYSGDLKSASYGENYKRIYVLKGENLQKAMDELEFELPIAWDRDLLGFAEGEKYHPPRVNNKYVNEDNTPFVPINDFSKYTVDGPMHFTAVWKKKPITLIFKEGELEQAKYKSGRKQQTIAFAARDIIAPYIGGIIQETYMGSLYDSKAWNAIYDPEDPNENKYPGYEDLYLPRDERYKDDWEFLRWETGEEFLDDKIILDAEEFDGIKYPGLEFVIFPDDYTKEPYVFTPVVDKIQIPVNMYSPFPIFPQGQYKRKFNVGSGTKLGEVDDYINADFKYAEQEGYHFAGWYMIDHDRIAQCDQWDYSVDDIEFMMEKGMPTVVGFSKPGLDTWFKYVQCSVIDDTDLALGQYLTKIDGEYVLNKKLNKKLKGIDILALYSSNLTLDAGDGYFENPIPKNIEDESSNEDTDEISEKYKDKIPNEVIDETTGKIIKKTIKGIMPMIDNEPICTYVAAGYEVPKSNDPNKKFAGWRLESANGKYFSEYEPIQKDTYLVATYIDKVKTIKLTIDLHGAEKTVVEKDEEGNTIVKVEPMEPIVMELPQGTLMEEVEMPVVKRKGYEYWSVITQKDPWYLEYDEKNGYSNPVMTKHVLDKDTTIHLMWTPLRYSYDFLYEIDGVKDAYKSVVGLYGDKISDCEFYQKDSAIGQMFDFSLENQPKKGYKITKITMHNENGKEVTKDSVIEGSVRCWLTVEPIETTITFDANGGELEGENTIKVPFATSFKDIESVPKVSKEGLTFVGWVDDNNEKITADYRIKEKTNTFKAQWTNINFTLVFDAGEGKFANGSKQLKFENVPLGQVLKSMTFGNLKYEEPTLKDKVFKEWEINLPTVAYTIEWKKDNEVGYNMHHPEKEAKSEIVLKASYVDKTISFTVKLFDPTTHIGYMTFANLPHISSRTLYHDEPIKKYMMNGIAQGGDWVQTVKEGMTFNQWFDYIYDKGYRYRTENGFELLGWKHEEPASEAGPRKDTKDMPDVDMDEPIKDGAVFTPLLAKGYHYVWIYANGGAYDKIEVERHLENGVTAYQFDEDLSQMMYVNVPAGTRADRIDPSIMPKRLGYTLVGYSRLLNPTGKSLSANPFVAGTEHFYAIWSENKNQVVQPTVHRSNNSRRSSGGGGSNGGLQPSALQNANDPRIGVVGGLGPQSQQSVGDQSNKFTQNVSEETKKQSREEVNQILSSIGISGSGAGSSSVKEAAAEVEAGINLKEQYARLVNQVKDNPSITEQTTRISDVKITNNQVYWHTDENGNVTLESLNHFFYDKEKGRYSHNIVDAWQPITNETGQTGWYKFDKNGYMQTGLVQDGQHTYYLSEEKGAGYGQMVCNQTVNIGGLSMTFNEQGALIDMNYNPQAAIKTLQDAASKENTSYIENDSITVPVISRPVSNLSLSQQAVNSNNVVASPVAVQSVKDPGVKQQNASGGGNSISPIIPFTARSVNNLGMNQQGISTNNNSQFPTVVRSAGGSGTQQGINNNSQLPVAVKSVRDPGARR